MDRRTFLATTGAALAVPIPVRASQDYTPGLVQQLLTNGQTVFLDFKASWCTTCAAQERVINALKSENPDYEANIAFVDVDWDQYRNDALTQALAIPRRSTLVVLKGSNELGRLVAGTSRDQIRMLMDIALNAAMA